MDTRGTVRTACPSEWCWSTDPVCRLVGLTLVVSLAAVVTAGPANAEESPTPGLWINPELGLRGPMASQGNDRSRASITRELCERLRKRYGERIVYPKSFNSCLVYRHVMALRPYEGELETSTTFLGTQYTVARLSPVLFQDIDWDGFYGAMMAEVERRWAPRCPRPRPLPDRGTGLGRRRGT